MKKYRDEVIEELKQLVGEWSTKKEDLQELVEEAIAGMHMGALVEDCGEFMVVSFEDPDGKEKEVSVDYELVGRTYTVTAVGEYW